MTRTGASAPKLNPDIASAPLYVAGTSIESARHLHPQEEIVKLASNESLLGPSPKALAAVQSALADLHRYPPATPASLYEALTAHMGHGLTPDHFVAGSGASELIDMLTRAFVARGENVVICRPTFPLYEICARRVGGEVRCADLDASFAFDVDHILDSLDDQTRIVYLCTPNNPTGTVVRREQAERLVAGIPPDVLIVFDESYRLFVEHESTLLDTSHYILSTPNVVSVQSLSKTYGLAGLRVGYAVAPTAIATYLQRLHQPFHIGSLALAGAIAALDDEAYLQEVRQLVIAERAWLIEHIEELDLEVLPSEANFLAIKAAYPAQLIYERMLAEGVIIRPLELFSLPDWFRVTVGRREENTRFIEVLAQVLHTLAKEGVSAQASSSNGKVMV